MAVSTQEPSLDNPTDRFPLLMEPAEPRGSNELVIDIERGNGPCSSGSPHNDSPSGLNASQHEDRASTSSGVPIARSPSSAARSPSLTRRGEALDRRWSPFNTMFWISTELVFTLGQIIAAIVVLSFSRHEKPKTPLFAWVVGYAVGCVASLPLLYWRYLHRNQVAERRRTQHRQGSARIDSTSDSSSYITISLNRTSDEEDNRNTSARTTSSWDGQSVRPLNSRLGALVDHLSMALDCFFAVWFVVGNVWIFGGHTSSSDAPYLYRLCIVFLTFSCIGYAMPFILCAMICCCLPCIISFLGVREEMNGVRGASEESISALPTHKFKLKSGSNGDSGSESERGGFVAAGTEKEQVISAEDAACCICLTRYVDNDELRELPCSHFFHTECVDKWLKINASCPLCKYEILGTNKDLPSPADPTSQA